MEADVSGRRHNDIAERNSSAASDTILKFFLWHDTIYLAAVEFIITDHYLPSGKGWLHKAICVAIHNCDDPLDYYGITLGSSATADQW